MAVLFIFTKVEWMVLCLICLFSCLVLLVASSKNVTCDMWPYQYMWNKWSVFLWLIYWFFFHCCCVFVFFHYWFIGLLHYFLLFFFSFPCFSVVLVTVQKWWALNIIFEFSSVVIITLGTHHLWYCLSLFVVYFLFRALLVVV